MRRASSGSPWRGILHLVQFDGVGGYNGFYLKDGDWSRIGYGSSTILVGMNERGVAVGYAFGTHWQGIIVRPRD